MAYLLLDYKFINDQPKLYSKILDYVKAEKIEQIWPSDILRITFNHAKIGANEVAVIRIYNHRGCFRIGSIHRTDRPFMYFKKQTNILHSKPLVRDYQWCPVVTNAEGTLH